MGSPRVACRHTKGGRRQRAGAYGRTFLPNLRPWPSNPVTPSSNPCPCFPKAPLALRCKFEKYLIEPPYQGQATIQATFGGPFSPGPKPFGRLEGSEMRMVSPFEMEGCALVRILDKSLCSKCAIRERCPKPTNNRACATSPRPPPLRKGLGNQTSGQRQDRRECSEPGCDRPHRERRPLQSACWHELRSWGLGLISSRREELGKNPL